MRRSWNFNKKWHHGSRTKAEGSFHNLSLFIRYLGRGTMVMENSNTARRQFWLSVPLLAIFDSELFIDSQTYPPARACLRLRVHPRKHSIVWVPGLNAKYSHDFTSRSDKIQLTIPPQGFKKYELKELSVSKKPMRRVITFLKFTSSLPIGCLARCRQWIGGIKVQYCFGFGQVLDKYNRK